MNSPWPQLELPELDGRLQLIAGYLNSKQDVNFIMDLNCGMAPLLKYLCQKVAYFGNDRFAPFIAFLKHKYPHQHWDLCLDSEVEAPPEVDCLMCLGYAMGNEGWQSETIGYTVVRIADEKKPPIVVLETWIGYKEDHGPAPILQDLGCLGYKLVFSWHIEPICPTNQYSTRLLWILELQN